MYNIRNKFIAISSQNPWLLFLPFLLFYSVICIVFIHDNLVGDENRYLMFANNILNGFYSPLPPAINLWNGPGYPLLISLFLFLKLPLITIRILNAVLLYISLVLSFKTINNFSSKVHSLFFTIILGLYFPIYQKLPLLLTEIFAWFLLALICFLFFKYFKQKSISPKYTLLIALSIAFLAFTKVIFGYVILSMFFVSIIMCLFPGFQSGAKKSFFIFLFSLIFCLPYLIYTYGLTGKLFYWGNSGSMSLYSMSSPFEGENGDFMGGSFLRENPNHASFFDSIIQLDPLSRDKAFKNKAVENIRNNPEKYFKNWIANCGRLLFSYPHMKREMSLVLFIKIIPNIFLVIFTLYTTVIGVWRFRSVEKELVLLFLTILIYLFGSSLVSAEGRMFHITIPFWIIYNAYLFKKVIKIRLGR